MKSKPMQRNLITLVPAEAKKEHVMEISNKNNSISRIILSFSMVLFTICLTLNVFFCSSYNLYEIIDKTTVNEVWPTSESITANEDRANTTYFKDSFTPKDNSFNESITKNINSILIIPAIPKDISLFLFIIIDFLFLFYTLFILLPDRWTLINQKVRLNH